MQFDPREFRGLNNRQICAIAADLMGFFKTIAEHRHLNEFSSILGKAIESGRNVAKNTHVRQRK